jgi:acyl-CoA thioesterase
MSDDSSERPHAAGAVDALSLAERVAAAMFAKDSASQALGMKIEEMRPGYARLSMRVREDMVNGHRTCHGGMIFTLADSAFAFACNTGNETTVAAGASIEFLQPGYAGDMLTAEAEERFRRKRSGIYDITVRNQDGAVIALFRGKSHQVGGPIVS